MEMLDQTPPLPALCRETCDALTHPFWPGVPGLHRVASYTQRPRGTRIGEVPLGVPNVSHAHLHTTPTLPPPPGAPLGHPLPPLVLQNPETTNSPSKWKRDPELRNPPSPRRAAKACSALLDEPQAPCFRDNRQSDARPPPTTLSRRRGQKEALSLATTSSLSLVQEGLLSTVAQSASSQVTETGWCENSTPWSASWPKATFPAPRFLDRQCLLNGIEK